MRKNSISKYFLPFFLVPLFNRPSLNLKKKSCYEKKENTIFLKFRNDRNLFLFFFLIL